MLVSSFLFVYLFRFYFEWKSLNVEMKTEMKHKNRTYRGNKTKKQQKFAFVYRFVLLIGGVRLYGNIDANTLLSLSLRSKLICI